MVKLIKHSKFEAERDEEVCRLRFSFFLVWFMVWDQMVGVWGLKLRFGIWDLGLAFEVGSPGVRGLRFWGVRGLERGPGVSRWRADFGFYARKAD